LLFRFQGTFWDFRDHLLLASGCLTNGDDADAPRESRVLIPATNDEFSASELFELLVQVNDITSGGL
jgi:hypothetical protein